jgi:uncharacterized repeat protein (TIGR01451 family)
MTFGLGLAFGSGGSGAVSSAVELSTGTVTIPTYPYANHLELRHSALYNMDYYWLDWSVYSHSNPVPQEYEVLVMENPWLRLTFLPELGGRLYGVEVKATGEQLLYQNPVIKPTHWGPHEQGWWLAVGGVEWCLPVDEHGYEWGVPWSYSTTVTAQGATVELWDTDATDRVRARISVYLPADRAAFEITPRLENPTGSPVSLKFWDNAMLAPGAANTVGPELRFVVPIDQVTVHSRGDSYLPADGEAMDWPVHGGTDYSRLGNWNRWLGFFARPQAAEDWAGVYDQATLRGVARVFPREVAVGVKGFAFGWTDPIDWHEWTDDGSTYVELHGGPSPTFWDTITLGPGESLQWTETWLPLQDLPALSLATEEWALGLEAVGADLHLGILTAGQQNDVGLRLWREDDCTLLWREDGVDVAPDEVYTHQLLELGLTAKEVFLAVFQGDALLAATSDRVCWPPRSQVDTLSTVQPSTSFFVSWTGTDMGGGLASYDVQVRDGDAGAPWTDWLLGTGATSALFNGQDGHTYTFRSRARDTFDNVEDWPANEWQDTYTTVLLEPAPVFITSDKAAQPPHVHPGDVLEFQIHPKNTGNLAAGVQITDPLPVYLELAAGPTSNHPPDPVYLSDTHTIVWSGTIAAGQTTVAIDFDARVLDVAPGGLVTNAVWIDDGIHAVLRRQVTVSGRWPCYLPLILKH